MKIILDKEKLIGFRVLNATSIKKPSGSIGVLLKGARIGKPAINNQNFNK